MHKKLWNKDFILIVQGNAVSAFGDILYSVAIGYWVYEKTGSSALMGIMSSISMFMTMFVMPFSGSIIDKCDRKKVIIAMDALRGAVMFAIGILAFADKLSVPAVLFAAFLASLCTVFFSPAISTLMIDVIPPDDMVRGQSVHSGMDSLLNLIGKAVSGALVAFLGVPLIIILNGISYLISAFTEMFITAPKTIQQGQPVSVKGTLNDFVTAIKDIVKDPYLKLFIPSALIINLVGSGPFSLMLPFVLEKGFTVDMYGYIMSVEMAASLICVFLLGIFKLSPRLRFILLGTGYVVSCVFYAIAFMADDFIVICVFLFLGGFCNTMGNTIFISALMLALPEANRGGILGFVDSSCAGGAALSAVIYGVLCDCFSISIVFVIGTALSAIPIIYLCIQKNTRQFILEH